MKILLVAINAKYIHSNLAVFSLRAFAGKYAENIQIAELTINHAKEDILKEIYREKADVVAFSCYIWNIDIIRRVTTELKKVQKNVKIWYGGPEVSYDANQCLKGNKNLDGIMIGEGEQIFLELANYYIEGNNELEKINGLAYRESAKLNIGSNNDKANNEVIYCEDKITVTSVRQPLDLDTIPFPYRDMQTFQNRIIYYESSRGCPFSCSYCLSSIDKRVRLRSSKLVTLELKLLMDYKVPQVKFVDRTFNCNKKHAMDIWSFIKENDNGITNFHFEISADLLTEEEMEFLATLRPGQVQFEIGVQSTNADTVAAIHRKMDIKKLSYNVKRLKEGNNIHQHLDLIAGLPMEDYASFEKSFGDVYNLKPDQ
ncbi:MAG: radical SAM protein, partial [Herbinix sp.]|nr:radical SAM protein [Herbinix sp.]